MKQARLATSALGIALGLIAGMLVFGGCSSDSTTSTSATTGSTTGPTGKTAVTGLMPPTSWTTQTTKPGSSTETGPSKLGEQSITVGGKSKEDYEKELPDLQAKVQASPRDLALLQQLALAQYNTGRLSEAASTYERMLALADNAEVHNNYGNVLRDLGRFEHAVKQYEKAIAIQPTLFIPYINLANMYLDQDQKEKALAVLDKGIANLTGEDRSRMEKYRSELTKKK